MKHALHPAPSSLLLSAGLAVLVVSCGGGSSSSSSSADTAATTVPAAPTIGAATALDESASIAFTAPSDNGGATITSYTATCVEGANSVSGSASTSPISVSPLTNDVAYSCSVTAANSAGQSAASGTVSVTPTAAAAAASTAAVDCPYSGTFEGTYSGTAITATWDWTCGSVKRFLSGNGLPDHVIGTFPNAGNPNTVTAQTVSAEMTLTPVLGTSTVSVGGPMGGSVYARNSVKFDPGTAGTCPGSATQASDCNLANGSDVWRVEALGQDVFDFGEDMNNAHAQPTGQYHYHGMPEGMLTNAGASDTNKIMVHVGWADDGFPVYARYCYADPLDASSEVVECTGSYELDSTADTGRPDTSWVPLGAFGTDWNYVDGSGDLDECNGRFAVTPEFPDGIYHYMVTDTYPYFSRCLKGER